MKTVDAIIDEKGDVKLLEPVQLAVGQKLLVTVMEEPCEPPVRSGLNEFLALAAEIRTHTATRPQTDSAILVREDRER